MFCLCTLYVLARQAQAKIQMLTTSSQIVTILLKSFLKSLGLYLLFLPVQLNVCLGLYQTNFEVPLLVHTF